MKEIMIVMWDWRGIFSVILFRFWMTHFALTNDMNDERKLYESLTK